MRITFSEVQRNLTEIANRETYNRDVIFEILAAYGRSRSSITKLRDGALNLSEDKNNSILQRNVVYSKHVPDSKSLPAEVEKLEQDPLTTRYNPRFLIATDYKKFAAKDTKKGNTLETKWKDIDRNVDFFYGWTGDERIDERTEAVADRRAADKMKELYHEIEKIDLQKITKKDDKFLHDLNVFFSRLLFCFFAEDTQVFSKDDKNIFTDSVRDFTQVDGSDLDTFLGTLFEALDKEDKSGYSTPFSKFPYVNGRLFDSKHGVAIPKFNAQARKLILDCGSLNWSEINPDIFGSMFQGIARSDNSQQFTSVPNILKTIEPLFLDELRDEFDKYYDNPNKLMQLYDRISNIKIFDPACGSGNFLIVAYKELRKLEHAIIDRLYHEDFKKALLAGKLTTRINLDNFYGIEIDDFACETAVLSLHIAKHQMNIEFEKQFGKEIKLIPLKDRANIVHANSARIDWQDVCPNKPRSIGESAFNQTMLIADEYDQKELLETEDKVRIWEEIYVIGNPPYLGGKGQSKEQKEDLKITFNKYGNYKELDYIAIWFIKAAEYAKQKTKISFVTTSSINQGSQVEQLWPEIFNLGLDIIFAYLPFTWSNNAKGKVGVSCSIIGLGFKSKKKVIINGLFIRTVSNINGYLLDAPNLFVRKANDSISGLPKIITGNTPYDGTHLMLNRNERDKILNTDSRAIKFIRKAIGANELMNNIDRWCIWISPEDLGVAMSIPFIAERVESVRKYRENGGDVAKGLLAQPYRFRYTHTAEKSSIIIPIVSSGRRKYLPVGVVSKDTIIIGSAAAIYDPELWVFGVISSLIHMTWVKATAGRLREDIRYLSALSYNTFPIRSLSDEEEDALSDSAREILFARENHSEKTLAQMYDPDKMPEDLREAHEQNDLLVDRLYRLKPYENDEERLADLFTLYEKMAVAEKEKNK